MARHVDGPAAQVRRDEMNGLEHRVADGAKGPAEARVHHALVCIENGGGRRGSEDGMASAIDSGASLRQTATSCSRTVRPVESLLDDQHVREEVLPLHLRAPK